MKKWFDTKVITSSAVGAALSALVLIPVLMTVRRQFLK